MTKKRLIAITKPLFVFFKMNLTWNILHAMKRVIYSTRIAMVCTREEIRKSVCRNNYY